MTTTGATSPVLIRSDAQHEPITLITVDDPCVTVIDCLHVDEADQGRVIELARQAAVRLADAPGNIAMNVLSSVDGSRVMTYGQWTSGQDLIVAEKQAGISDLRVLMSSMLENDAVPRPYRVVYTDDRSPAGVSVISPSYTGAIFVNEITTHPGTQDRLLELVIANNEAQSQHTVGYRSANFHQSLDGHRAVNYSLWDTQEHCIQAISAMADMDVNLAETVQIANPDFRFYTLVHATHA